MVQPTGGIAAFIWYNGRVFLMLRDDKDCIANPCRYAILSGAIEDDEPGSRLVTEIKEELGIEPSLGQITYLGEEVLPNRTNHLFFIRLTASQHKAIELGEGQSYEFCELEELFRLHVRGEEKHGLCGAVARLMSHHTHIVRRIFDGRPEPFKRIQYPKQYT